MIRYLGLRLADGLRLRFPASGGRTKLPEMFRELYAIPEARSVFERYELVVDQYGERVVPPVPAEDTKEENPC